MEQLRQAWAGKTEDLRFLRVQQKKQGNARKGKQILPVQQIIIL